MEAQAPDGSPVELYAHWLPELGEADLVHVAVAPHVTVLELGCGAGRVTRGLVRLGHRVVAVDESAAMLAEVADLPGVEPMRARIEELDPDETFGAVLLGSNLVNVADDRSRAALLRACRRHLSSTGVLLIERMDPRWADSSWAAAKASVPGRIGDVEVLSHELRLEPPFLTLTTQYSAPNGRTWWQGPYTQRILGDADMVRDLRQIGLRIDRWIPWRGNERIWCACRVDESPGSVPA